MWSVATVATLEVCGAELCGAQTLLTGSGGLVRIFNTDMAILEMQDARKDLPCTATVVKPILGFDLKFHAGYEVQVPLRELAGTENLLTILFRITPDKQKDEPVFLTHKVKVPSIEEGAKGDATLNGAFDLGEGSYHIDWLMRDRSERVCSAYWDIEATLPAKDKEMNLMIAAEVVRPYEFEQFKEEPPIERIEANPLNVKVLLNFAPQNARASTLKPTDTTALVSILRGISREPRIGKFSLVAFSMQEQRVVYRQENADKIDFPALGEALNKIKLGRVDFAKLAQKNSETQFLSELIKNEVGGAERPDALIFAGPKVMLEANVPAEDLKDVGELDYPVFYMNYNLYPAQIPWRDSISHAVKFFKGHEYTISRPRDLWFAMTEMVGRITKTKGNRTVAARPDGANWPIHNAVLPAGIR